LLKTPGKEQVECQAPKPILLDTGEMKEPYDWAVCLPSSFFSTIENMICKVLVVSSKMQTPYFL